MFWFYNEAIVPELFTKNIKIERTCKEFLEDIATLVEKSEITKKARGLPEVISVKKGADLIKILTDMAFLMKTIKYKAIQPLQGMELQRFYNKLFNFFKYF